MRKFQTKRIAAAALCALCCVSAGAMNTFAPVKAAVIDNSASVQNIAITGYSESLTGSSGSYTCYGSTRVASGYSAGVTVELQKYTSGWGTIMTWSASGGSKASLNQPYAVPRGTYRLKVTHKAYNSSGSLVESFVKYSNTVTY